MAVDTTRLVNTTASLTETGPCTSSKSLNIETSLRAAIKHPSERVNANQSNKRRKTHGRCNSFSLPQQQQQQQQQNAAVGRLRSANSATDQSHAGVNTAKPYSGIRLIAPARSITIRHTHTGSYTDNTLSPASFLAQLSYNRCSCVVHY